MRKTLLFVLCSLLSAGPVAALPVDVDQRSEIVDTVLEVVTRWLAKLGPEWMPGAESAKDEPDDDSDPVEGMNGQLASAGDGPQVS